MKRIFIYGEAEKMTNYANALRGVGLCPVFSLTLSGWADCDGLLLPGGADMDPARYGEENTASAGIDPVRDEAELSLIEKFLQAERPILGICRGFQVLNVALGGSLLQDVDHPETHRWAEEIGDRVHEVTAAQESFLKPLYGERFAVNSAHHQALGRIGAHLAVTAHAPDGVAEAMQWPEKRVYAVQFHPERMAFAHRREDTVDGAAVFRFFREVLETK